MRMFKGHHLIFLIIYVSESSCVIDDLHDAGEKIWRFYSTLYGSNLASSANPTTVEELFGSNDHGTNVKIRDQMYEIHTNLCEIEKSIDSGIMKDLIRIVESRAILVKCINTLKIFIESINDDYAKFYQIIIEDGYIHNRPLNDLIESVFSNVESNVQMIRKIMTDSTELLPYEPSLISAINGYATTRYKEICDSSQSIGKILVYLFKIVTIAEMKASLMWTLANLHKYRENEEWKVMNALAKTQFQRYFGMYVSIIQQNLDLTIGLYIRACDPEDGAWILNKNYYELDGITQAVIFRYESTTCPLKSCQNKWRQRATRCNVRYYDKRSSCSNTPTDCEDFGAIQACVLKNGSHKFQYVNSSRLGFFGNISKCPEDDGYILDNLNGAHAGYATCGCNCDGTRNKISLVIMKSPGDSNEVITGLRFKRQDDTLHIQPRVGKLVANGYIRKYSEKWLPIPKDIDGSQIHLVNRANRIFFLDDVILPPKFILTGVRFNKVTRGTVTGFAIKIFGVPFDFRSGQLDFGSGIWLSSARVNSGQPLIFDPINPLQMKLHNTPSSPDLKYVQLKQSSLRSDFGQSMLPLFDAVPVTTDPPSALGGIGIFHKGVESYGGFISLKAYGIRYEQYFENFTTLHTIDGQDGWIVFLKNIVESLQYPSFV